MKNRWLASCMLTLILISAFCIPLAAQNPAPHERSNRKPFFERVGVLLITGLLGGTLGGTIIGHFLSRRYRQADLELKDRALRLSEEDFYQKTGIRLGSKGDQTETETPYTFAQEYESLKRLIDDIQVSSPTDGIDYATASPLDDKIRDHVEKADKMLFSEKLSNRYRAAYHYALAAYANSKVNRLFQAGHYYHFAGHQFRQLGEYELAGMCYKWSGDYYRKDSKWPHAGRAYRRARKVFSYVGDEDIEQRLIAVVDEVSGKAGGGETLEWWGQPGAFRKRGAY